MTDEATLDLIAGLVERIDEINKNLARIAKTLEAVNYQGAILHQARR
jgi:hypothetical protein